MFFRTALEGISSNITPEKTGDTHGHFERKFEGELSCLRNSKVTQVDSKLVDIAETP